MEGCFDKKKGKIKRQNPDISPKKIFSKIRMEIGFRDKILAQTHRRPKIIPEESISFSPGLALKNENERAIFWNSV